MLHEVHTLLTKHRVLGSTYAISALNRDAALLTCIAVVLSLGHRLGPELRG